MNDETDQKQKPKFNHWSLAGKLNIEAAAMSHRRLCPEPGWISESSGLKWSEQMKEWLGGVGLVTHKLLTHRFMISAFFGEHLHRKKI